MHLTDAHWNTATHTHTQTRTYTHTRARAHTRTHIAQLLVNRWKQCDTSSEQRETEKKTPHVKQLIVVYWLKCAAECFAALPVVSSQVCDLGLGSLSYIVHLSGSAPRQSGEEPTTQNSTLDVLMQFDSNIYSKYKYSQDLKPEGGE